MGYTLQKWSKLLIIFYGFSSKFLMTLQILGLGILFRVNVNEVDLGSAPFLNSSKSIYKLFVVW